MKRLIFIAFTLLFLPDVIHAQVTRGPYIQKGTPSSVTIRWRTATPVIGKLYYGTALGNLSAFFEESSATTEHIIEISGLLSNTKYYYEIATPDSVMLAANAGMYFKTSPVAGTVQPIRVWAIGDFGNASQGQIDVMNTYLNYTGSTHTDVWLWLGDNAYGDGTQQEYQTKVFDVYVEPFRKFVVWPSPGNHDYGSININHQGPYYDIFTLPTNGEAGGVPSGEEGYYSYDYGNAHFISLTSEYLLWTLTDDTPMTNWLEDDLQNNDKDWVIVYWHQPPYTRGSHDSDEAFGRMGMMRSNINPILEHYGVDLVLCGHSHCYERSYLMKGHFGLANTFDPNTMIVDSVQPFTKYVDGSSVNQGTVYAVVGVSGQLSTSGNLDHPAIQFDTYAYNGSLVIDIDSLTLTAKFLTAHDGIKDSFVIEKKSVADPVSAIRETTAGDHLSVFPNPAKNSFGVQFDVKNTMDAKVVLLNIKGEEVAELYRGEVKNGDRKVFSAEQYPSGLYFIRLVAKDFFATVKVVLEK